jgi:hypothetical protein
MICPKLRRRHYNPEYLSLLFGTDKKKYTRVNVLGETVFLLPGKVITEVDLSHISNKDIHSKLNKLNSSAHGQPTISLQPCAGL